MRAPVLLMIAFLACQPAACSGDPAPQDAGLWPFPRMETLEALQKNHRALRESSRTDPRKACVFARFGTAQWLLAAHDIPAGHRDALFSHFGISCPDAWRNPDCADRLLGVLEDAFGRCAAADAGLSAWGKRFVHWQRALKPSWDREHFEEAMALLDSPMARETRIVLLGAFVHALPLLQRRAPLERTEAFVRWLGFPCPVWAASFTAAGPADNPADWPAACMISCPEARISEPLADFSLRARKLSAACPPQAAGFERPEDWRFYSLDNHLVFRTAIFWRQLLSDVRSDPHPLSWLHAGKAAEAQARFESLELPLFPTASFDDRDPPGPPDHSLAATQGVFWPVIHIHAFGAMRMEEMAVYHPASGRVDARMHPVEAALSFLDAVRAAAVLPEPTLSLSGPVSTDQFLQAAAVFREAGHARLHLLFRNASQVLRACTLELDGPPPADHDILLTFGPGTLALASRAGPLASDPFRAAGPHDFSGLRQKLEQIRARTPRTAVVHMKLEGGMAFASVAKLLGYVMRNASGRRLFGTIRLVSGEK